MEIPLHIQQGQAITGELRLAAHNRQSYDVFVTLSAPPLHPGQPPQQVYPLAVLPSDVALQQAWCKRIPRHWHDSLRTDMQLSASSCFMVEYFGVCGASIRQHSQAEGIVAKQVEVLTTCQYLYHCRHGNKQVSSHVDAYDVQNDTAYVHLNILLWQHGLLI